MSPPSITAFISYAKADQAKAQEIADALEQRGFRCWIAPRDVRPGRAYGDEIIRGIEGSRALILVLSSASNESGFVSREIERAVSKNKHIFTVRIEDVLPSPGLELFISSTQWIDAFSGRLGPHIDRLAQFLAEDEAATAAPSAVRASPAPPPGVRRGALPGSWGAPSRACSASSPLLLFCWSPNRTSRTKATRPWPRCARDSSGPTPDASSRRSKRRLSRNFPPTNAYVGTLAEGETPLCNATLVGADVILTSNYCFRGSEPQQVAFFVRGPDGKLLESQLTEVVTGAPIRGVPGEQRIAVAKLASPLGNDIGWVKSVGGDPAVGPSSTSSLSTSGRAPRIAPV